jgi:hypothetical protein
MNPEYYFADNLIKELFWSRLILTLLWMLTGFVLGQYTLYLKNQIKNLKAKLGDKNE